MKQAYNTAIRATDERDLVEKILLDTA